MRSAGWPLAVSMSTGMAAVSGIALELAADLLAAHLREHQVEHDGVGAVFARGGECLEAVVGFEHGEAGGAQLVADEIDDIGLVIDDQHGMGTHKPLGGGPGPQDAGSFGQRQDCRQSITGPFMERWPWLVTISAQSSTNLPTGKKIGPHMPESLAGNMCGPGITLT